MGGIGAADIFPRQANMSVPLAHTAIRIFHLFPSRPITALNTGRVSWTNTGLYYRAAAVQEQISRWRRERTKTWTEPTSSLNLDRRACTRDNRVNRKMSSNNCIGMRNVCAVQGPFTDGFPSLKALYQWLICFSGHTVVASPLVENSLVIF